MISYLDPFVVDALIAEETRPRVAEIGEGALIILRGVNLNENADPEDMVSIRIWADRNRIITSRKRPLLSVRDIVKKVEENDGPGTTSEFLVLLTDRLTTRIEETIEMIEDRVALVEEETVEANRNELRKDVSVIRREAIMLRRYLAPQREALARLYAEKISWLEEPDRIRLREVTDKLIRYVEDLDSIRDRASVIHEELANRLSEQMNTRMYVLSLVAAIFLPLGFLTGLLGINVGGIPGANSKGAFFVFVIILAAVVAMQLIIFKIKKWL